MEQIQNIINNYHYLQEDYLGINFNIFLILNLIINIAISSGLIIVFYLLGNKIKNIFLNKNNFQEQELFLKIAFGYIFIGIGLATLGFFSLLRPIIISSYIILILLTAIFPFSSLKKSFKELNKFKQQLFDDFKIHRWIFIWVILFIFLGFLKLQLPEIREDQYHTDLPVQYLRNNTIMLPSKEQIMVSASPQLAEMSYIIAVVAGSKEASRYIHFTFYILALLILYSLSRDKKYKYVIIAPLIFITAPEIIRETSSQYTDFQWIVLFLLSVIILVRSRPLNIKLLALSGFIFGSMVATKLWTVAFIIVPVIYILINYYKTKIKATKYIIIFILFSLIAPSIWFLRSFILTGNPVYPAFTRREILENTVNSGLFNYITFNSALFNSEILKIFSLLFFLGLFTFISKFKDNLNNLRKDKFFLFFILLFILYTFINYPYGRYLLGLYSIAVIIISMGLYNAFRKNKLIKYSISLLLFFIFTYYFINSLLILPYGIGFADKNKYLTRTLSRDNSSYYDFDHKFNKFIFKTDLVATYKIFGYYYADFNYIDISYIFDRKNTSFDLLKERGITKLFIKDGDITWFCKRLKLSNCNSDKYVLLSYFSAVPYSGASYYLYKIK